MTVSEGPGSKGTRVIARRYPVLTGLIAGTTKQEGRAPFLLPKKSVVKDRSRAGL